MRRSDVPHLPFKDNREQLSHQGNRDNRRDGSSHLQVASHLSIATGFTRFAQCERSTRANRHQRNRQSHRLR